VGATASLYLQEALASRVDGGVVVGHMVLFPAAANNAAKRRRLSFIVPPDCDGQGAEPCVPKTFVDVVSVIELSRFFCARRHSYDTIFSVSVNFVPFTQVLERQRCT
jgi:hypothetical protein